MFMYSVQEEILCVRVGCFYETPHACDCV